MFCFIFSLVGIGGLGLWEDLGEWGWGLCISIRIRIGVGCLGLGIGIRMGRRLVATVGVLGWLLDDRDRFREVEMAHTDC